MNKTAPAPNTLLHLSWDSHFFGFNIGRIYAHTLTVTDLRRELEKAAPKKIQFVELCCETIDKESIYAAEGAGFFLADIRITLENTLPPQPSPPPMAASPLFKKAVPEDLSSLQTMGHSLFQHSRYYRYPKFETSKVDLMFQIWIEKSITGQLNDELYYLAKETDILAFCSLKYGDHSASIGLFGVNPAYQGKGLGGLLLKHVFHLLATRKITRVDVVTQGQNFGALHLYHKHGFFISQMALNFYKWME